MTKKMFEQATRVTFTVFPVPGGPCRSTILFAEITCSRTPERENRREDAAKFTRRSWKQEGESVVKKGPALTVVKRGAKRGRADGWDSEDETPPSACP